MFCKYYLGMNDCVKDFRVTENMRIPIPSKYMCSHIVHFPKYECICTSTPLLTPLTNDFSFEIESRYSRMNEACE